MPIEIKELNIKVVVSEGGNASYSGSTAGGQQPVVSAQSETGINNAIVEEAVQKVLEILKNRSER